MNPLLGGALGSNIAEKKRVQALVWRSHTLSVATPDYPRPTSTFIFCAFLYLFLYIGFFLSLKKKLVLQIWRRVIFAVLSQSVKTANIMRFENLALYHKRKNDNKK